MSNPIAADVNPIATHLDKGKEYYWCTCGRSKQQPFCDGSHRGTGLEPLRFAAEEAGEVNLCQCKGTRNRPFCDGSHVNFRKGQEVEPPRGADDQMPEPVPTVEEPMVASDESSRGSPTLVVSGCRDALGPSRLMK
jgi:CDGSH-type Zn-finger protein